MPDPRLVRFAIPHLVALPERVAVYATVVIARTVTRVVVVIARAVAAGERRIGSTVVAAIIASLNLAVAIAAVVCLVFHAARFDRIAVYALAVHAVVPTPTTAASSAVCRSRCDLDIGPSMVRHEH